MPRPASGELAKPFRTWLFSFQTVFIKTHSEKRSAEDRSENLDSSEESV